MCLDLVPSSRRGPTVCLAMRPETRLDAVGVLFEVSDHPPAWFSVPDRDLQPHLADVVYRGALQGLEQTWQHGTPAQIMHAMIATANARYNVGVPSVLTRPWTAEDAFVAVTRATDEAAPLVSSPCERAWLSGVRPDFGHPVRPPDTASANLA